MLGAVAYLHAHATGRSVPVQADGGKGLFEVMLVAVQLTIGLLLAGLLFRKRRPLI